MAKKPNSTRMLLSLYKGLMQSSTPLLEAYLGRRLRDGKEDPARAGERRGEAQRPRGENPLIWFHAASVGESLALLALVEKLLSLYPEIEIMVTTGTVTSAKLMAERLPARAFHQYIPVDHPAWVEKFLDHWKPNLVLWSESDFWPNMLASLRRRNIPAVLLNARMSEKSFRFWQLARGMISDVLSAFTLCLGQNEAETTRLKKLGGGDVRISGNLKYAATPLPYDRANFDAMRGTVGQRPRLLWASTHPDEDDYAFRLHHHLRKIEPKLLTIIVPRHPVRGGTIAGQAEAAGLHVGLRSEGRLPRKEDDIYVADTLGELGLFYRLCPMTIVGGSFVPVGGHNIIEPAQLGCRVFYGPHMFNFSSICHDFESHNAAYPLRSEQELQETLSRALRTPGAFDEMGRNAQEWTQRQAHIIDDLAQILAPLVQKTCAGREKAA